MAAVKCLLSRDSLSAFLALVNLASETHKGRRIWRSDAPFSKPVISRLIALGLANYRVSPSGVKVLSISAEGREEIDRWRLAGRTK